MAKSLKNKLNLAVLISGRGSNLQSIIDACADENFPATIKVVISNEPDAYGLERAKQAGIATEIIHHKAYPSRKEFEQALQATLEKYPVELICLAGFMRVLTSEFVSKWDGKMLNIHPSLLPAYPGLHTHERVLAGHEKESGCTIHFVTPGLDEGPTLLQKRVPVLPGDTPETLGSRVLEQEHVAYPEAIRLIALGKVRYLKETVEIDPVEPYTPPLSQPAQPSAQSAVPGSANGAEKVANYQPKPDLKQEPAVMDHHQTAAVQPDDKAVADAYAMWGDFTKGAKYTVIGVVALLIFMALALL